MRITISPLGETEGMTMSVSVHVPRPTTQQVPSPREINSKPVLAGGVTASVEISLSSAFSLGVFPELQAVKIKRQAIMKCK